MIWALLETKLKNCETKFKKLLSNFLISKEELKLALAKLLSFLILEVLAVFRLNLLLFVRKVRWVEGLLLFRILKKVEAAVYLKEGIEEVLLMVGLKSLVPHW